MDESEKCLIEYIELIYYHICKQINYRDEMCELCNDKDIFA